MSQPKRYSIRGFSDALVEEDNGVMVKWDDYAAVKAEVDALREAGRMLCEYINEEMCEWEGNKMTDEWHKVDKWDAQMSFNYSALQAEVERLRNLTKEMDNTINTSQASCRQLKAENERLRNDANELADNLEKAAGNTASHYNCLIKWRAAKGVQS